MTHNAYTNNLFYFFKINSQEKKELEQEPLLSTF